jgi:FkbM family methyltransferase
MSVNWSGINRGSIVGRAMRAPLRLIPGNAVMTIRRGPARGMRWIAGSATHGCWLGTYELAKQQAILRFAKPGMTIYDVGAQAGFYTLLFSRVVGPSGTVVAFEPCPNESRHLLAHLSLNAISNVRVISAAVSDRESIARFTVDAGVTENSLRPDSTSPLFVPTVCLDQLELPPPDLIKMDIEGAETLALKGARKLLAGMMPVIFLALHGDSQRRECSELLRAQKYNLFDLAGRRIEGEADTDEIYAAPADLARYAI